MSPLTPLLRAFGQLDDPGLLRVIGASLALALVAFIACFFAGAWLLHWAFGHQTWWLAGVLGGVVTALLALFLYVPLAAGIAAMFSDAVANCVERRWYPSLPPPRGAALAAQVWDGVALGLRVLLAQVAAVVLTLLLPGIGWIAGLAISAWALGRGLYVTVAMRRGGRQAAIADYARHRPVVLSLGAMLALLTLVPLANLLVPVLGIAAMVHVALAGGETA